jgi:hypothetical protein
MKSVNLPDLRIIRRSLLTSIATASLTFTVAPAGAATTIFSDDFSGGATVLNGTTPDVGGVNWVAAPTFLADGSIYNPASGMPPAGWAGTATLAFTPVNGLVYTLDASITVAGDGNWIALGFVNGQSASADPALNRFIDHDTVGKAWMLKSGNGSGSALLGNTTGTTSNVAWASGVPSGAGNFDMRIVLDTTGGTGAWTATWYAKESSQTSYTEVRSTATLLAENITSVGLAKSNTGVTGSVTSFSLTSVPEPSSAALLSGFGVLALLRRRRR